jgi:LemA protein
MALFSLVLLVVVGMLMVVILYAIGKYNGLVHLRALTDEGWSGIDVQLKRRYDLIPNLVAVVKQYSIHEKEVLENVTKMRSVSMNAHSVDEKIMAEKGLSAALRTLFAVAENYPTLKANENFLSLQQQLSTLETEIQLARRYYNGAARNYNVMVAQFPSNIIANLFSFTRVPYFELATIAERETPKITF